MTYVVTEGQLAQLDRAPSSLPPMSVRLSDDLSQDYATIYRTNPQVRTVISFLARNIAQISLHTFERVSAIERIRLEPDHPLVRLLRTPNPKTTAYRLIDSLVHDMGIYDNCMWLKIHTAAAKGSAKQPPRGLLRLPPQNVRPIGETWMWADGYRLRGSHGHRDFTPDQVVHFRGYNPDDARWGLSPMETLRRILAEEYQAGLSRDQLHRNGARFTGWIERPHEAPKWSRPAAAQFAADFHATWAGSGPGAGGTPILEEGMKYTANGVTPKELQYLEVRKLTREEVAAAFHIPPPLIGILDHATFSNITQQHQQLYQDTLGPWLKMIAEEIQLQLIPDFDNTGRVYVEFNILEKLTGAEDQFAQYSTAVGGPWMTRNEIRARQNLSPLDGGDELITPMNVTVGGQASPQDSAPPKALEVR